MSDKFLGKENTDVLWEVLADDDSVPKTRQTQETFVWLLPRFHAKHGGKNMDLMSLNKQFISDIMKEIEQHTNTVSSNQDSTNDRVLVTSEDLRSSRTSEFERDLKQKEDDFRYSMARSIPQEPDFKDNVKEQPLGNVNDEIERMIRERNLDISSIQKTQNVEKASKWLSSTNPNIPKEINNKNEQSLKTIKIEENDLGITFPSEVLPTNTSNEKDDKHVSWGEELTINISESEKNSQDDKPPVSIFSKLKTATKQDVPSLINNDISSAGVIDIERLYVYITERFNKLEKMLEQILEPSRSLSPSIMEKEDDNSLKDDEFNYVTI